ncbi:MAG: DUF1573 domain-containing protein [Prevotella sp.]|nr:DUF1573 domain-containing protein [Prevotella sp.]
MLVVDSLVAIGLATLSLGTIQEADGTVERSFWLRNCGTEAVALVQGYTSCGCTTIEYTKDQPIAPGDSTCVTLRFNPRGKGGEFLETGTVVYSPNRKRLNLSLEGTCITSEETLMRQFPIRVNDHLRLSTDRFDLGRMAVGETKERSMAVLHRDENDRQEHIPINFIVEEKHGKGLQHISHPVTIREGGKEVKIDITLDVFIK